MSWMKQKRRWERSKTGKEILSSLKIRWHRLMRGNSFVSEEDLLLSAVCVYLHHHFYASLILLSSFFSLSSEFSSLLHVEWRIVENKIRVLLGKLLFFSVNENEYHASNHEEIEKKVLSPPAPFFSLFCFFTAASPLLIVTRDTLERLE